MNKQELIKKIDNIFKERIKNNSEQEDWVLFYDEWVKLKGDKK